VSVVSDSRLIGLEAKLWKLCLELLWRGQMRTLIISLKKQFLCGKMNLSTGSYITNPSCYMSSASDVFDSITALMFPYSKDVD
jgi:hypothetical protein